MTKYRIYNITYDDGHSQLPKELFLDLSDDLDEDEREDELSDFISNETGFCHKSFSFKEN
jgi:hypothetical protein